MTVMSILFSLLCVGSAACGGYPFFLAAWVGCLFWMRVKRKWLWGFVSVPVYVVLVVGLLVGVGFYVTRPAGVYEDTFGSPPPAGVTDIESSAWVMGDSGTVYLRFKVSGPGQVQVLTQGYQSHASSLVGVPQVMGNVPSWWTPPSGCVIYSSQKVEKGFSSESRLIYYDPVGGEVYFCFSGID
jgi:hypothetical protein